MSDAFTERLRLIRFRRKREHSSFRDELRIIPRWLVVMCLLLYILALIIGFSVNHYGFQTNGPIFPGDESLRHDPELSYFELGAVITFGCWSFCCPAATSSSASSSICSSESRFPTPARNAPPASMPVSISAPAANAISIPPARNASEKSPTPTSSAPIAQPNLRTPSPCPPRSAFSIPSTPM